MQINPLNKKLEYRTCNFCGSNNFSSHKKGFDRIHSTTPDTITEFVQCRRCSNIYLNPVIKKEYLGEFYPSNEYYTMNKDFKNNNLSFSDRLFITIAIQKFGYSIGCVKKLDKTPTTLINKVVAWLLYQIKKKYYIRRILPNQKSKKLLEYGFGGGKFLSDMAYLGWSCSGIEQSAQNKEQYKELGIHIYDHISQIAEEPQFDVIYAYHSIEHEYHPLQLFVEFSKRIKKNGKLIVGVPNHNSLLAKIFGKYWDNLGIPIHLTLFNQESMRKFQDAAGFEIIEIRHSGHSESISGGIQWVINDLVSKFTKKRFHNNSIRNFRLLNIIIYPIILVLDLIRQSDACEYVSVKK